MNASSRFLGFAGIALRFSSYVFTIFKSLIISYFLVIILELDSSLSSIAFFKARFYASLEYLVNLSKKLVISVNSWRLDCLAYNSKNSRSDKLCFKIFILKSDLVNSPGPCLFDSLTNSVNVFTLWVSDWWGDRHSDSLLQIYSAHLMHTWDASSICIWHLGFHVCLLSWPLGTRAKFVEYLSADTSFSYILQWGQALLLDKIPVKQVLQSVCPHERILGIRFPES